MRKKLKRLFQMFTRKPVKGVFWIAPNLYIHFVRIDPEIAEVWVTRDCMKESRNASTMFILDRSDAEMFVQMDDETKQDVLGTVNRYLLFGNERLVRKGDGYAIIYTA